MQVDTGAYQGLAAQVAALEARVDALSDGLARAFDAAGMAAEVYRLGWNAGRRHERLGEVPPPREPGDGPRGRHLRLLPPGGGR